LSAGRGQRRHFVLQCARHRLPLFTFKPRKVIVELLLGLDEFDGLYHELARDYLTVAG
jgi:hypothetical protein